MVEKRARKSGIVVGDGIYDETKEFIQKLIHGRREYSPSAKVVIVDNYYDNVKRIEVRRSPLPSWIKKGLNLLTNGELDEKIKDGRHPQEDVYHISMIVELSNGKKLLVEKNHNVVISGFRPLSQNEEKMDIMVNHQVAFGDFLEKALHRYGAKEIFQYRAKTRNCGIYVEYLLKANNLYTDAVHKFIFQDTQGMLDGHRNIEKLVNTATDLAGRMEVLKEGGAIKPNCSWIEYVNQVQKKHKITYKEALKLASKSYVKKVKN